MDWLQIFESKISSSQRGKPGLNTSCPNNVGEGLSTGGGENFTTRVPIELADGIIEKIYKKKILDSKG